MASGVQLVWVSAQSISLARGLSKMPGSSAPMTRLTFDLRNVWMG